MSIRPRPRFPIVVLASFVVMMDWSSWARAHGPVPACTPIDRLVTNLQARIEKSPDDPNLHYMLGRLHAMAFETKNQNVPVWASRDMDSTQGPGDEWDVPTTKYWVNKRSEGPPDVPSADELALHLTNSVLHLNRAIKLAPSIAGYRLALASILEAGEPMASESNVSPLCPVVETEAPEWFEMRSEMVRRLKTKAEVAEEFGRFLKRRHWSGKGPTERAVIVTLLRRSLAEPDHYSRDTVRRLLLEDWKEEITEQFFMAFSLALPSDGARSMQPAAFGGSREMWVGYEAASSFVRIVEARGIRGDEKVRHAAAKAALSALDGLPSSGAITPIVFSLASAVALEDLCAPGSSTTFDLDGTGLPQLWPWVRPDTAILVWDSAREGRITSGRQLFGSVTWWMFFANGYDALDALDDDGDGELAGPELTGLAVWRDRDGDGRSDPGEVVPVEQLDIAGLSCRATGRATTSAVSSAPEAASIPSPWNPTGLRLNDGTRLPTYDWVATPLRQPHATLLPEENADDASRADGDGLEVRGPRTGSRLGLHAGSFAPARVGFLGPRRDRHRTRPRPQDSDPRSRRTRSAGPVVVSSARAARAK